MKSVIDAYPYRNYLSTSSLTWVNRDTNWVDTRWYVEDDEPLVLSALDDLVKKIKPIETYIAFTIEAGGDLDEGCEYHFSRFAHIYYKKAEDELVTPVKFEDKFYYHSDCLYLKDSIRAEVLKGNIGVPFVDLDSETNLIGMMFVPFEDLKNRNILESKIDLLEEAYFQKFLDFLGPAGEFIKDRIFKMMISWTSA